MTAIAWRSPANLLGQSMPGVGELVRTGENVTPQYQIIATTDDRAWIRDMQHGTDHVFPIDRCHGV